MSAYPTIAVLDPLVANQIAAGEVVERPASVVKELVENSLDAGATRVQIRLTEGGRHLIQVTDNGCGLDSPSARLAFARHATSKLRSASELMSIGSFGFRGEALASILSVSQVTLTSRRPDAAVGVRLEGGGKTALEESPAGCPVGTDIQVRDLFYNVPARLKFLRTPATELGQVLRYVDALALARPSLHLSVVHNDRKVCDYPPDPDLARRAHAVLGPEVARRLYPVHDDDEYEVEGLLSDPGLDHVGPSQLVLLVNGRPVSDRTLQHAVTAAYGTLLERGRYPQGVLSLRCPPNTVDVNVHPQKTEVRFVSSQAVHVAVARAIRTMLAATPWALEPVLPSQPVLDAPAGETPRMRYGSEATLGVRDPAAWRAPLMRTGEWKAMATHEALPLPQGQAEKQSGQWSSLRYIGQAGLCFLVCETQDALVLIDQHAAHERVLFEQFVRGWREGEYASQQLLIPVVVPLGPDQVAAMTEAQDLLSQLGFDIEASGERIVRVRAQPALLRARDVAEEVRALAASLVEGGRGQTTTQRLERSAATLACHAAVRAGDPMTAQAVADLLKSMDGVDLSAHCPHGRPVTMRARFEDVGRWFNRT